LAINRETVGRYLRSKPAKVTPGVSGGEADSKPAISTPGFSTAEEAKPAISTLGSAGRRSDCEAHGAQIEVWLQQGLSLTRIHQDLVCDHGFSGSYQSVKRFARRLGVRLDLPFRRMECAAGEELQADFGRGAWIIEEGRRRRPHLFRCVLSHSRKGYTEVAWRQTTEAFIRCLENAFRHFGGVPGRLVVDSRGHHRRPAADSLEPGGGRRCHETHRHPDGRRDCHIDLDGAACLSGDILLVALARAAPLRRCGGRAARRDPRVTSVSRFEFRAKT
jgi:hypothetical protein